MRRTILIGAVPAVAAAVAVAAIASGGPAAAAPAGDAPGPVAASIISIDRAARTATLPLLEGRTVAGAPTSYVVTESSDAADAKARGVTYAPKLKNALGTKAVQKVSRAGDVVTFPGTVDFAPKLSLTPNKKTGFPPTAFKPGSVGDAAYSPLITAGDGIVLNAPQIANDSGQADTVMALDKAAKRVTLQAFGGYVNGAFNLYIRTEGSDPLLAALESTTYAKNLAAAPGIGSNAAASSRSAIVPVVNGPLGKRNPRRQGLQSALLGQGQPLNLEQEPAGDAAYSPLWDVTPVVWTKKAVKAHRVIRLTSTAQVAPRVAKGYITSLGKQKANRSLGGLRAIGFVSNCSIVSLG
jgi:hypothetical protein